MAAVLAPHLELHSKATSEIGEFRDDFSVSELSKNYVAYAPGFSLVNGVLRAEAKIFRYESPLNIFPSFGSESEIQVDVRWIENQGYVAVLISVAWRYRSTAPHLRLMLAFDRGIIQATSNKLVKARYKFEKEIWYKVHVKRNLNHVIVAINDKKLIEVEMGKPEAPSSVTQEEIPTGGFALGLASDPGLIVL